MVSTEFDYLTENFTNNLMTFNLSGTMETKTPSVVQYTSTPSSIAEYVAADFEILLPCILGLVVTLALTMVSFYVTRPESITMKNNNQLTNDKTHLILNGPIDRYVLKD